MHHKPLLIAAALLLASAASFGQTRAKDAPVEVGPLQSEVYSPTQIDAEQNSRRKWMPSKMTGYVKEPPPALKESPTLPCAPEYCPRTVVRVRADRN